MLNVLRTAHAVGITVSHRAAACNVLCAFLDQAFVSPTSEMRSFILSVEIWRAFFAVYMDRYGDSKPKPMKQVLVTLVNSLSRWPSPEEAQMLREEILDTFLFWIHNLNYTLTLKPALHGLAYYISKGLFSVKDVVVSLQRLGSTVDSLSAEDLTTQVTQGGRAAASSSDAQYSAPASGNSSENLVETFICTLLIWASHTGVATSASHLISTVFKTLRNHSSEEINFYHSITKLPLWVAPLKDVLERKPETIEALKHHVLPAIFMLSPEDLRGFINSLHLERCLSGKVYADDHSGTLLLLSSLQVAQDLGLVRVTGKSVPILWAGEVTRACLLTAGRSACSKRRVG